MARTTTTMATNLHVRAEHLGVHSQQRLLGVRVPGQQPLVLIGKGEGLVARATLSGHLARDLVT